MLLGITLDWTALRQLKYCEWNSIRLDRVASCVLQGSVLGSLLYSLHINDIMLDIESEKKTFC